ncbi:MAG: SDR family NAD(P)-dependent oxidoreductase, partial [Candidatus Binatia bacterium]|nr:SDR family NAD(P)-dependent oxidoreductase [Candidatus Binatia bacterium]
MDYKGKTAVITGGASGVGRAMGARFLREGMKVVLSDVESGPLQATVDELLPLGSVSGVTCDVSKFEQVENLASEAVARHGKVHLLCNNAGVSAYEDVPAWDLPINDWRWVFDVNIMGVVHGIKAFVPGMIAHGEEGAVMNTSSGNGGLLVLPFTPSYSASKAAVSSIT